MSSVIERQQTTQRNAPRRVGRFIWETLWAPFWIGSTLPAPPLTANRERAFVGNERTPKLVQQIDSLRNAIWRQRRAILVSRTAWLALLPAALWLTLRVLAGRVLPWQPFFLLTIAIVAAGMILSYLVRPSRQQLAQTMDRSFKLRERVATALEETGGERLTGLRALQVLEATQVTQDLSSNSAFRSRVPARELVALLVVAVVCLVLLILLVVQQLNPQGPLAPPTSPQNGIQVPGGQQVVPGGQQAGQNQQGSGTQQGAGNQPGQTGSQGQSGGQPSAQGQRDLDTLASALADHGVTRSAADKLANGDYAGAAQAIREAGSQAAQMSPEARQALANDLKNAANNTSDPKLAQDLKDLADQLAGNNPSATQGAFNQVANDIDRIGAGNQQGQQSGQPGQPGQTGQQGPAGGQGASGGSGAGAGAQLPNSQQTEQPNLGSSTPLLGADGKPIELPKGNPSGPPINTQNPNSPGNGQTDPGAASTSGGQVRQGAVGESGVDPNSVPYDQRGSVERYFTPEDPR